MGGGPAEAKVLHMKCKPFQCVNLPVRLRPDQLGLRVLGAASQTETIALGVQMMWFSHYNRKVFLAEIRKYTT